MRIFSAFVFATIFAIIFSVSFVCAQTGVIKGKHLENGLTCVDCHQTEKPDKRASASTCIDCHGQTPGEVKIYHQNDAEIKVNPHDSHEGEMRCTLCHSSHAEPKLVCADCHSFSDMIVK